MTEKMIEVLKRTENTLCSHLVDLNDQVELEGHIKDPMVLDGIKDSVKSLKCIKELLGGNSETAAAKIASKLAPGVM